MISSNCGLYIFTFWYKYTVSSQCFKMAFPPTSKSCFGEVSGGPHAANTSANH